jgi:hypothetical protein
MKDVIGSFAQHEEVLKFTLSFALKDAASSANYHLHFNKTAQRLGMS